MDWFLKSKRAISPILATLLLIVLVVAASIAAYAWVQSSTEAQITSASGFIIIENVRFYDSNQLDITVKNTGTSSMKIDAIYIDDIANSVTQNIPAKKSATITLEYSWASGRKCKIKVVSTTGLYAERLYSTPSESFTGVWYDQSWIKRKTISIDNTLNPNNLTEYQVQVDVQYDSDMNPDFSDLRFVEGDHQTPISYWIESYVPLESARVWLKISEILGSDTKTINMYYGNPSASSLSDSDNTFLLFINFTRDGIISYGGSQDNNPAQTEIIDDTILRMWGNNWKSSIRSLDVVGDGSQAICFDFLSNGTQGEINGIGLDTDNSISSNRFYRIYGTQNWGNSDHYGYIGSGDWQYYSIVLDDFAGMFDRFVITNDADGSQATNIYYKNVRISKYTSQKPLIDIGIEEVQ